MKVILGLGNPGLRFRFSRHNLGLLVIEKLAKAKKIRINQRTFNCLLGEGAIENQQILLAEPLTYVNLSGEAASAIVKQKKIQLKDLLVICDDVNLPVGKIRIRPEGSAGGHKGLRSIIERLETEGFSRLRIGVGRPRPKLEKQRLSTHVLGEFNKKEIKIINQAVSEAVSCCEIWIKEGIATAMNRFNQMKPRLME